MLNIVGSTENAIWLSFKNLAYLSKWPSTALLEKELVRWVGLLIRCHAGCDVWYLCWPPEDERDIAQDV